MDIKVVLQTSRLPFLILTPVCVFLGLATAVAEQAIVDWQRLMLSLLAALFAHVSVNALNEFSDFRSGLDMTTARTPFSGGSGALPAHPSMAWAVLALGLLALLLTVLIGVYFLFELGTAVLWFGLPGLLLVTTYTDWINRYPLACLVAPGLGFGLLMVTGSYFVLAESTSNLVWLVALVPFFLVNNLLLLNQYPDIDADKAVGRYHMPIAFGLFWCNGIYGLFLLAVLFVIVVGVCSGMLPALCLLSLLPMPLALLALFGIIRHGKQIGYYPQYLAANVAVTLLVPIVLGATLILG